MIRKLDVKRGISACAAAAAAALALTTASAGAEDRIIGGTAAPAGRFPAMAALLSSSGRQFCGGTVIHPRWVLTAKHCGTVASVRVDSLDRTRGGRTISVISQVEHPSSDVQLLELEESAGVEPATVFDEGEMGAASPGATVTVSGWGRTVDSPTNPGSDALLEADVSMIATATCNASDWYNGSVQSDELCAGLAQGGVDTCQGDSGGPLWVNVGGVFQLAGVTSWGWGCAEAKRPGVYVRTGSVSAWIAGQVPGAWTFSDGASGGREYLNWSSVKSADLGLGDFNDDGKTDVFHAGNGVWQVSWSGTSAWERINTSSVTMRDILLGDFNKDGATDVFSSFNGKWWVSYSGTTAWTEINTSHAAVSNLRLGDFNEDGRADVFTTFDGTWWVSYSGKTQWTKINTSSVETNRLAIADFDGDGTSDVFSTFSDKWWVSYGGKTQWTEINRSTADVTSMAFGDFDGNGKDDVLHRHGGGWYVSFGGKSAWSFMRDTATSLDDVLVGDLNRNGTDDVFVPVY